MNFSGKGNSGWSAQSPSVQHHTQYVHETRKTETGEDGGIQYWYEYANQLAEGVKGLFDKADENLRVGMERKAIDAGLRAVIRALLKDLRAINPTHPLLDKKVRDRIFSEFEQEDIAKNVALRTDKKMWKRERPEACQSE